MSKLFPFLLFKKKTIYMVAAIVLFVLMRIVLGLTTTGLYLVPLAPVSKYPISFMLSHKGHSKFSESLLGWQLPSVHPPCEVKVACSLAAIQCAKG